MAEQMKRVTSESTDTDVRNYALAHHDALKEAGRIREEEIEKGRQATIAELSKSTLQRTQEKADKMFKEGSQFSVSIPKDKAQPKVVIRANSEDEAVGRYNRLCGIRQTEHTHEVVAA